MHRQIIYPAQIPLETDLLNSEKNALIALGGLALDLLGTTTQAAGLVCAPTTPASLAVQVGPGRLYSLQNVDGTAYSSLAADTTHQILKQGILLDPVTLACPAPVTGGFSVNYLIEAIYQDVDTNNTVLPYYNASNPAQTFSGQNNNGVAQPTQRQGQIILQAKAGIPATTGTQTTPAPDAGYLGLYVVIVANGQATVTSANISSYSGASFFSTGPYLSGARTPAEIAAGVTVVNPGYAPGTIDRYGTNGTGIDMTAAIQAAINQAQQPGGAPVVGLASIYLITSGVTINGGAAQANVHIYGQGRQSTIFLFNPPTNTGTIGFNFTAGASVLYRCSIERCGFQTGNTNQKTYVQFSDTSDCAINDFEILQLNTSLTPSIGIYLKGREMTRITDCQVQTEQPLRIGVNPNSASFSCDLLSIRNWKSTVQSGTAYGITCDNNVNITNMNWGGYIHHSAGGGLFQYINTTAAQTSYNWKLGVGGSMRCETGSLPTNFDIDIEMSAGAFVQDVTIANFYSGSVHNGIKLRGCLHPVIADSFHANSGGSKTILDADSSNSDLDVRGYYTSGTTPAANMGTLVMRTGFLDYASLQPIPPYSMWSSPTSQALPYGQIGPMQAVSNFGFGTSATSPAIATSGTVTATGVGIARYTPTAAVTGLIVQPGTIPGQKLTILNQAANGSGFSMTFAATGTSNVNQGASLVIPANGAQSLVWDDHTALWYVD